MTSAALPPVTLSAIPPASTWSVPISVGMDKLRPYTAYVFEVSAFTSDGEGQIASTMVRMPEAGAFIYTHSHTNNTCLTYLLYLYLFFPNFNVPQVN